MTRFVRLAGAFALCGVLSGCGGGLSYVTGTISLDGKPMAANRDLRVMVVFSPDGHNAAPGTGFADEMGRYVVITGARKGLARGKYFVTVTATQVLPPAVKGAPPGGKLVSPERYADPKQSGFRAEVTSRKHVFDFQMQSDSKSSGSR